MSIRDRITESAGKNITFLPGECDKFLLGFAVRGGSDAPVACYGYQAAKAAMLDRYRDAERAYAELNAVLNGEQSEHVLWLYRYSRGVMWDIINREQFKRWESLDQAVVGIGELAGDPVGIVYNRALCIDIVAGNTTSSNAASTQLDAIDFVNNSIVGIDLQERTPWFLTHVK